MSFNTQKFTIITFEYFNFTWLHTGSYFKVDKLYMYPNITRLLSQTLIIIEEYIFSIRLINYLITLFDIYNDQFPSSDRQFGYKKGHSTTLCALVYYYVNNNTSV